MLKKFILSLTIMLLFCGISHADFIYATEEGKLGTIRVNSSYDIETPSALHGGTISSPLLTSYWNGKDTNLLLIDRYGSDSGDRGYIFNPSDVENFTESRDIPGVYGAEFAGYAESGYSIFLTSGAKIFEVSTSTFRIKNSFDCERIISRDGYDTEICALHVDTSTISVLLKAGDSIKYARFDGQLKSNVRSFLSADMQAGASAVISTYNSRPLVGHSTGIDTMRNNGKFYQLISTDHPVKAMCQDENDGLFFAEQETSGDKYINTILHYLPSGTSYFTPFEIDSSTPDIKLLRDYSNKETFAAMINEKIIIATYKDGFTTTREYSASTLGGTPVGITTASVSGYDPNKSSSGCDSFGALIILAAIPFVLKRK